MEQPFITDSGERLNLRLQSSARLGAGGQGQVFRASLGGSPVAVKLLRNVEVARLEALRQLPPACDALHPAGNQPVRGTAVQFR
jgi:hypothetical protein